MSAADAGSKQHIPIDKNLNPEAVYEETRNHKELI
jgi:hypothetical protein